MMHKSLLIPLVSCAFLYKKENTIPGSFIYTLHFN